MLSQRLLRSFRLLIILIFLPKLVAADVSLTQDLTGECQIMIEGEIRQGDAAEFERISNDLFDFSPGNPPTTWPLTVCLNSVGGSYPEAINIALLLKDFYQTKVTSGSRCYSACGIIFLAGSADPRWTQLFYGEEDPYTPRPMRILSPRARLGFHAPYLSLDNSSVFTAAEVNEIIQDALVLSSLTQSISSELYPPDLMAAAMRAAADELFMVEEVGQLNAWKIDLDTNYMPPFTVETFQTAWIRFSYGIANGRPGYGSFGESRFGVMEELPTLFGTSGWGSQVTEGLDQFGNRTLYAESIGKEASWSAAFTLRETDFLLSTNRRYINIEGWQLSDPHSHISDPIFLQ